MPQLFTVLSREEAWARLEPHLEPVTATEIVSTDNALGRVLSADVLSGEDLPAFPRSSMDGYALRAEDSFGSTEGLPSYLKVVGEIRMGAAPDITLGPGEAALIHTGGMLPAGATAVVMVENIREVDGTLIEVTRPVARGENVLQVGEDVKAGQLVLAAGTPVRPSSMAVLLGLGITKIEVFSKPRVALISTGDELVPPQDKPLPGQIRNTNMYMLASLIKQAGGMPIKLGIVKDRRQDLVEAAKRGLSEADIVVISAGSSVSTRDMSAEVINSLGEPGVLVHGVAIRPGKPVILGALQGKPVFGLPGNPASALVTFELFVTPAIHVRGGYKKLPGWHSIQARMTRNVASVPGREDYAAVRIVQKDGEMWAEPVFSKSNFLSTMMESDGLVQVPINKSGLAAGDLAMIRLFQENGGK